MLSFRAPLVGIRRPVFRKRFSLPYSVSIGAGDVTTGTLLTATVNGLVGGEVVTYQWTDDGVNIAGRTSQTYTPAIGTDSVADASLIRCVATVNGVPYPSNARRIVYAVGSFAALTPQTYTDDTGNQTYTHAAATGTGLTWTYAATGLISGVTYDPATRTFTSDTNALAVQSGTNAGSVSATDQYGRPATGSPRSLTLTINESAGGIGSMIIGSTFQVAA